jgi:NAD(P) transhydrogenase subunit alpha
LFGDARFRVELASGIASNGYSKSGAAMIIGIPRETYPNEQRVALIPPTVSVLRKAGLEVAIETGAGEGAGLIDDEYVQRGAKVFATRKETFSSADILLQVRTLGANPEQGRLDLELLQPGQTIIGYSEPLTEVWAAEQLAKQDITSFSMELIPRITRAQSMDTLSSMATIAGYKAVLLAANHLPKMFPMLMTAAGTLAPAKVFVMGVGVAGLQAIATARKLGAVVEAYDIRPAVKEQVMSLGAKFVSLELDTSESEDSGGYAKELGEEFYRKQREMMQRVIAASDVVITTAAIPGKKAPILVTGDMVRSMAPGSVIVDIAAERGGNCELTKPGETVVVEGVTILGPLNIPTEIPFHASQMYSKNIATFLLHMVKDGTLTFDTEDEIIANTLVTHNGEVVNPRVREILDRQTDES